MQAPREEFLYLACLHEGTGVDAPDFLAVVDAEDGRIVHELPMPNVGDELHHFGWNRCSLGLPRPRPLAPDRPRLPLVADPRRRTSPTTRAGRDREGDRAGGDRREDRLHPAAHRPLHARRQRRHLDARRRRRQRRRRLRRARREDVRGQGPLGERRRDASLQLRLLVPAAQERARLDRVRRAERLREGLRPRGRRGRPLRQQAPLLEPRRAHARADGRPRRERPRPARGALAPRPRRGRGLRRRGALEHDVALPPRQRQLDGRPGDRGRGRPARGLAVPGPGPDHRPGRSRWTTASSTSRTGCTATSGSTTSPTRPTRS